MTFNLPADYLLIKPSLYKFFKDHKTLWKSRLGILLFTIICSDRQICFRGLSQYKPLDHFKPKIQGAFWMYTVEVVGDKRHINDKTPEDEIEFDSGLGFTQER